VTLAQRQVNILVLAISQQKRHDIAEIMVRLALNTNQSINQSINQS
jgi:hypothetical protein